MRSNVVEPPIGTISALFQLKCRARGLTYPRDRARDHVSMVDALDIVIYEEDFLTRTLLEEWLGEAGYRVRVGNRCNPDADAPCDLVILSVYMPKQGGARVRARCPGGSPGHACDRHLGTVSTRAVGRRRDGPKAQRPAGRRQAAVAPGTSGIRAGYNRV